MQKRLKEPYEKGVSGNWYPYRDRLIPQVSLRLPAEGTMRKSLALIAFFSALFVIGPVPARCQTTPSLPGCEPSPEVRKILDEKLAGEALDKMKFAERVAFERQVLEDLITKYPREIEPYRRLIQEMRYMQPDAFPAVQKRFARVAAENPNDPLALVVGARALFHKDTAEAYDYWKQRRPRRQTSPGRRSPWRKFISAESAPTTPK